ncbi:exopolysaccharide production protein ExoQ [Phyllobacterium trifolii]|uniref:Exopolysaccharide production protein ExoQ n=1 Tax=Phyllobacterium trifolii TaxID=300193 RepID=A0A839U118_9HYPH|nr:O-antigen ligase [Phyllobacterium trifolii]MBB3144318.1 exopolysaccharide production protein ExoQ [Phyllobacterium trifolii]
MRIAKSLLVEPGKNFWYGTLAVGLSVFVFAYSTNFGFLSILVFYGLWLPLVLVDYRKVIGNYARFYWVLPFVLLACMSFLWSAAPPVTLRAGIQYLTTIICALIASRIIDARTFASGVSMGVALVLLYSLGFGQYQYDALDGSYSFVGAFASKNQLGFFASLGVYFAFASFFVLQTSKIWRCIAVVCGILSAYCLVASSSATSVIATLAIFTATLIVGVVLKFSPKHRRSFFVVGVAVALVLVAVAINAGAIDLVLGAFGKNSTLTGRTYLWQEGFRASREAPLMGIGYQAYWVQGFSEAERLWAEFYIPARTGFHFHNTYIEVLVELGYVGVVLISLLLGGVVIGFLRRLLTEGYTPQGHLMFGIALLLLIRSFFEIDFIQPYTIGSFLLYYSAGLLAIPQRTPFKMMQPTQLQT